MSLSEESCDGFLCHTHTVSFVSPCLWAEVESLKPIETKEVFAVAWSLFHDLSICPSVSVLSPRGQRGFPFWHCVAASLLPFLPGRSSELDFCQKCYLLLILNVLMAFCHLHHFIQIWDCCSCQAALCQVFILIQFLIQKSDKMWCQTIQSQGSS